MTKILIVEDEAKIARFVELELVHEGYEVVKVADGRAGVEEALGQDFDLVLLDVMLPELNGLEVLRRIRREKDTPVIMLTARDAVMDKVSGLDAGADDYITKPFAIEELLARVRVALKKRQAILAAAAVAASGAAATLSAQGPEMGGAAAVVTPDPMGTAGVGGAGIDAGAAGGVASGAAGGAAAGGSAGAGDGTQPAGDAAAPASRVPAAGADGTPSPAFEERHILQANGVVLDVERHTVTANGNDVELTLREFEVLRALMEHKNIVMSRDRLASLACGYDYVGETNIIDVYIRHLRAKIDDRYGIKLITTVRGVGYVIREG